jgi:hypothetical protein
MRRFSCLIAGAASFAPMTAMAQQCEAPAAYCVPQCAAPAPAPPAPAPPAGNFLRGPATGQAAGESRSMGLRGFTLRIPAITVATPTLELPSLFKLRRDAEMHFDSSTGPLTSAPVHEFGTLPAAPAPVPAPVAPAPAPVYYTPPACAVPAAGCTTDARSRELDAKIAELERLQREVVTLRDTYAARLSSLEATQASAQPEGAAKPAPSKTQASAIRASRPLPPVKLVQAGYNEPAVASPWAPLSTAKPVDNTPQARRQIKPSVPALKLEQQNEEFGEWNNPSQP